MHIQEGTTQQDSSSKPTDNAYEALKARLRWKIRRAQRMLEARASIQWEPAEADKQ